MNIIALLQQMRFIGLRGIMRGLHFALLRQRRAGRLRQPPPQRLHAPGLLLDATPSPGGAVFTFREGQLEVVFLRDDMARVRWQGGQPPLPYALTRAHWPEPPVTLSHGAQGWLLQSEALQINVLKDGGLRFCDPHGAVLLEHLPPERQGDHWLQRGLLQPAEHLYGLGERAGSFNLRGQSHRLWNNDPMGFYGTGQAALYINLPFYLGLHQQGSYGIFYENSYPATVRFAEQSHAHFEGGALHYYFFPGPPGRVLERYSELTGRPAMPPRWALGFHQSRWSYRSEAEVRALAEGFRSHDLPLHAIHLDIDYMHGYRVFTVDQRRFGGLPALARALDAQGIKLVTILDPGVKHDLDYALFREGLDKGYFCRLPEGGLSLGPVWPGWCAFPDFSNPAVREWWGGQYAALLNLGVRGFWHDMNEPSTFATWGDLTLPLSTLHHFEGRGGDHREGHNLYGLLMAHAAHEALLRLRPGERPFILTRSGWAGLQRYAWTWTGDTRSTWAVLRQTVSTVLGLSISGIPYSGPDVGGFNGAPSAELYLRWLQLAALLPFFRAHSALGTPRREPWSFGAQTLAHARVVLKLRQRLMPYLYTLAWRVHQTGHPFVRPLFWPDAGDPALWGCEDAFLLGDALLVAPVVEQGAVERSLTLPSGRWYNFWQEDHLEGHVKAALRAPLERIPLLVRAGSVLPLEEQGRLALHLYPPSDGMGQGLLYSDDGDGDGPWRLDRFALFWQGDTLVLTWQQQGDLAWPYQQASLQLHGESFAHVVVDGDRRPLGDGRLELSQPAARISFER